MESFRDAIENFMGALCLALWFVAYAPLRGVHHVDASRYP